MKRLSALLAISVCAVGLLACGSKPSAGADRESGPPSSCAAAAPGTSTCGTDNDNCCASLLVTGGTFLRSYDGATYTDMSNPATVSSFRLDAYEVTVGRFRPFVAAVVGGWVPPPGSGKHEHLNGGGVNGGTEHGWDASWSSALPTAAADWTTNLQCGYPFDTWTAVAGANESLPINCATWFEAYAFCIWDGGFLPTEAEWNYAAAGGSDQRIYPWSSPPSSTTADYSYASYDCLGQGCDFTDILTVGSDPKGDGKWGQTDLSGSMAEWNLDVSQTPYPMPCADCAALGGGPNRVVRGGGFMQDMTGVLAAGRDANVPAYRNEEYGVRCARKP
jgi:formylglycine-generating enzyme required for sulfatase activity